jgi:archaellum component FlaF (FlaF/FlaG flagellin family)
VKNHKVAKVSLIAFIVILTLNIASVQLQHSSDSGATQITSPFSQLFASAQEDSNVKLVSLQTGGTNVTTITGTFKNEGSDDVYIIAKATVRTNNTYIDEIDSSRTLVPAQGTVSITITFDDIPFQRQYQCLMPFTEESTTSPSASEPEVTPAPTAGSGGSHSAATGGGSNLNSAIIAIVSVAVVAVIAGTGFMMFKKTRFSEQKVRRFTSSEYQDWVMKRLGGHAGSVLDTRKGIDGFTGDNVPIMLKQSDNVGKFEVQNFMNALVQTRARNGIIVAFGFDTEAHAVATRARMNRIDIKLVTVKELIDHKETALL